MAKNSKRVRIVGMLLVFSGIAQCAAMGLEFDRGEAYPLNGATVTQYMSYVSYQTDSNAQAILSKYGLSIDEINAIAEQLDDLGVENSIEKQENDTAPDGTNALQFQMQYTLEEMNEYSAQGTMNVNGSEDTFFVQGNIQRIQLDNGDICFAGGMSGYLNGEQTAENAITLSMSYDYTTGDCLIMASLGSGVMLDFGEPFAQTTDIAHAIAQQRNEDEIGEDVAEDDGQRKAFAPRLAETISQLVDLVRGRELQS